MTSLSNSSLDRMLRVVRRHLFLVLFCLVAVPGAVLAWSVSQEEKFEASASLLFRDPAFDQTVFGASQGTSAVDPQRQAATNVELVSLVSVAERVARELARPGVTTESVATAVNVAEEGESDLVRVTAEWNSPEFAATLANRFATEYIEFRREADRSKVQEAKKLLDAQAAQLDPADPAAQDLVQRSRQLDVLASLQTGNAELVEEATPPTTASSPSTKRNVAAGILLGLVLGVGLALLWEQLDKRLKDSDDVQELFDLPVIAHIPASRDLARTSSASGRKRASRMLLGPEMEAFRLLRANLRYFDVDREIHSILTTSAAPGDGKTTVAWNLALASADAGKKVLFIEADLRRPALAERLGASDSVGLSLYLTGTVPLESAVTRMEQGGAEVDVLFAGLVPPNPSELIESEQMSRLIREAEKRYDAVIIDTPPTALVADAIPLLGVVDGVLVVARLRHSRRDTAVALRNQLAQLGAPTLGLVINGVPASQRMDYYGYHRTGGPPVEPSETPPAEGDAVHALHDPARPRS